jgi:hypothetical protein
MSSDLVPVRVQHTTDLSRMENALPRTRQTTPREAAIYNRWSEDWLQLQAAEKTAGI